MNKYIITGIAILLVLALIPYALIAKARVTKSGQPRIHLIPDMDSQPKFKAQSMNPLFADLRAMRPQVPGTVARGQYHKNETFYTGKSDGEWITTLPVDVTMTLMKRGQNRFRIFCAPCHGQDGYGEGMVAVRAERLQEGTWTQPTSYHTGTVRERQVGHIFNTISKGIRNMPAYGSQIDPKDRWAIVAYVRALQRSQNARLEDVPEEYRADFR